MKTMFKIAALIIAVLALAAPARAQMQAGLPMAPIGYCQIPSATLASSTGFSGCVAASFTGTCSNNVLTASSVTGDIGVGWTVSGTGITAGTTVQSFGTGIGGAGTYILSAVCTSSSASLTTIGPPVSANTVMLQAETQNIRWRDDGGTPTTTVGMILLSTGTPMTYNGTLSALRFIDATAGGILNASFYKAP